MTTTTTTPAAPSSASIDLTLMFGAESYIRHGDADRDADPWRRDAFQRFVDVVLSGAEVQYPIPDEPDTELRLLGSHLAAAVPFHQLQFKSAPLNATTEAQVLEGFSRFLREPEKRLQLARWLRFQLSPNRVEPGTYHAKREPITHDSFAAWVPHRRDFMALAGDFVGLPEADAINAGFAVQTVAETPEEFAVLYAFDIYRRGWQYARFAGERGARYYPHMFRSDCLDQKGEEWRTIVAADLADFSWSKYFLTLIAGEPYYRDAGRIADLLDRVRNAQQEHPLQPWPHLYLSKLARRDALLPEEVDHIVATLNGISIIAKRAKLPLLPAHEPSTPVVRAAGAASFQVVKKVVEEISKKASGILFGVEVVKSVVDAIPAAKVWVEQQKAAVLGTVFRGSYNYTGLLPPHVSSFYELFEPTY